MVMTAAVAYVGHNRIRYLFTSGGADTLNITTTGAATPDILTDLAGAPTLTGANKSPLERMCLAFQQGYGLAVAGVAIVQASARAIWMNDASGFNIGNANVARAQVAITKRTAPTALWTADATASGNNAVITIANSVAVAASAYVDVFIPGTIGS